MHWHINHLSYSPLVNVLGQNPAGSGSFLETLLSADWANTFVALLALLFAVWSYSRQERKNREATARQLDKDRTTALEQQEREQAAKLDIERMRQQTIQLEWFRETVRERMELAYQTFNTLRSLRERMRKPQLSETDKEDLVKEVRKTVRDFRNDFLEVILYVHVPTYETLKAEIDTLGDELAKAIINDELKFSIDGVYERHFNSLILACQQRFFRKIYTYRGEE